MNITINEDADGWSRSEVKYPKPIPVIQSSTNQKQRRDVKSRKKD